MLLSNVAQSWGEKRKRRINHLIFIRIYCEEAIERWESFPSSDDPDVGLKKFDKRVEECAEEVRKSNNQFTPFIPFSENVENSISLEKIHEIFGYGRLSEEQLGAIVRFIHAEELTYALANDLRSEHVRKELSQDRKAKIFLFYGESVKSAYRYAREVVNLLK
ncbi:MAG: hypothetical protein F4X92_01890 [Gammaproteobacteria bacterium]|nr:hypothetical protein [Gammaproteobacteria bacterium]